MTFQRKFGYFLLIFTAVFALRHFPAQAESGAGVAVFVVNGPKDLQYLARATQDAVVGALLQKGLSSRAIDQPIDPDKLRSTSQGRGQDAMVVAGRVNIVGETYRVMLKWVNAQGQTGQDYLEVQGLNQLLPQLESYAKNRLAVNVLAPSTSVATAPVPEPKVASEPKAPKVSEKKTKVEPVTPAVEVPAQPPPVKETKAEKKEEKVEKKSEPPPVFVDSTKKEKKEKGPEAPIHDYSSISQHLPYEVRAMAFGDADGDGSDELVLTGTNELHVYRVSPDGSLQTLADYFGKKLDNFVKVDIWKATGEKPRIVLTNLRGDQAASQILQYQGSAIQTLVEDIPYQMRVVLNQGKEMLLGEAYHARTNANHEIYELSQEGKKLKPLRKMDFPYEVSLYGFDWVPSTNGSGMDLAALTPSGKLKIYKDQGGKYKGDYTSRESYGGSANGVPVEVKNMFNEVSSDYYIVPMGMNSVTGATKPDLILAKNDALLKEILGRKPVVTDSKLVRARWDNLGFIETWTSQKIDGSVMDFRLVNLAGQPQILVAVQLRDEGFFGPTNSHKDSVLLVYNLN